MDLPDKRRKEPHRRIEIIEEPKQADHSVTMVIVALTAIVFVLDVLTPTGIAIWALYVLPLGFTGWSSVEHVVFIVAGACTAPIILGDVYSPPGGFWHLFHFPRSFSQTREARRVPNSNVVGQSS